MTELNKKTEAALDLIFNTQTPRAKEEALEILLNIIQLNDEESHLLAQTIIFDERFKQIKSKDIQNTTLEKIMKKAREIYKAT